MKQFVWAAAGLVLMPIAGACVLSQGAAVSSDETSFEAFLPRFEAATSHFVNADPTPLMAYASQRDDATIMGGWGAYEQGWNQVGARYEWAAARFRESGATVQVEYLSSAVGGDLAYTVAIERSEALVAGQDKPVPMALRVTHVFRKEDGEWKLVHRHADPLINKTAPDAVLDQ